MSSSVTVGPNVTELEIKGLKPFTGHVVRVAAYNKAGKRFSSEVFFTTAKNGESVIMNRQLRAVWKVIYIWFRITTLCVWLKNARHGWKMIWNLTIFFVFQVSQSFIVHGIWNCYHFVKVWYKKGKALNLGVAPFTSHVAPPAWAWLFEYRILISDSKKKWTKELHATEWKRRQNLADVSHCRAVFFTKLNETVQTAPIRRKENIFRRIFTHSRFWNMVYARCFL